MGYQILSLDFSFYVLVLLGALDTLIMVIYIYIAFTVE